MSVVANQIARSSQSVRMGGLRAVWGVDGVQSLTTRSSLKEIIYHHLRAAWVQLSMTPWHTAVTLAMMSVVLTLCVLGALLVDNTKMLLEHARASVGLSIFLEDGASGEDAQQALESYFQADSRIASYSFEPKEKALENLRRDTPAISALLEGLESRNPLPSSYTVRVVEGESTPDIYQELRHRFQNFPGVEIVQYNNSLLGELSKTLRLFSSMGVFAILAMLFVASFIVATTIVISIDRRREEIVIMRLVGATEGFIRAPFVVEGIVKGAIGGICGIMGAFLAFSLCRELFSGALPFLPIWGKVRFLSVTLICGAILVSTLVGATSSLFAVRRAITLMED